MNNELPMKLVVFLLTIVFSVAFTPNAHSRVSFVSVEAEGYGTRKGDAVADALLQAVSQVNGSEVAGQTMSSLKEQSIEGSSGNEYLLSEAFQNEITTRSNGIVKSWSVLSEAQSEAGVWLVTVAAEIAKYDASAQLRRLRMAVVDFRLGNSVSGDLGRGVAQAFTRTLEDGLTQSRKFAMLDRSFSEEQSSELSDISSGGFAMEEMARIGNKAGTDYLIVGEVTKASSTSRNLQLQTSDRVVKITTSTVAISYRIIDVATSQLKFSGEIAETEQGIGAEALAKRLAKTSVSKILNAIFPVRVISIDNNLLTLAQGGDMLQPGRQMRLVRLGPPLIDPYTKESLGRQEIPVGLVEVIVAEAKMSTAKIIQVDDGALEGALIVRPMPEKKPDPGRSVEDTTKKAKQKIKALEEDSSDDW